jgi:hypothetical protein
LIELIELNLKNSRLFLTCLVKWKEKTRERGITAVGKVNLKELSEEMDSMLDEWSYYLDKASGKTVSVDDRYLSIAEDGDEDAVRGLSDWERDEVKLAADIIERGEDMLPLPDKRELGQYGMMEEFSENYPDARIRECLCTAIDGSGAFRRFKNAVRRFGIEEEWYAHRDKAMLEFARKWCEENGVPYHLEDAHENA